MKAGQETKMLRGAVWACVIPVGLGLIGLGLVFLSLLIPTTPSVAMSMSLADIWVLLPIAACFIFGAPLTAWLACRGLKKIDSAQRLSRWRSSAGRGVLFAGLVHAVSAGLFTIGVVIFIQQIGGVHTGAGMSDFLSVFFASLVTNLAVWVIITLPLSLLCATIFWRVTKFPKDPNVFD